MVYLFQNNGKACAAKSIFMIAFAVCMIDILYARVTGSDVNFSGWTTLLTVFAGLYWGRAKTKAEVK
jgi:hypothetical protein